MKIAKTTENILNYIRDHSPEYSEETVKFLQAFVKESQERYVSINDYINADKYIKEMVYSKFLDFKGSEDDYNEYVVSYLSENKDSVIRFAKFEEIREYSVLEIINPLTDEMVEVFEYPYGFGVNEVMELIKKEKQALLNTIEKIDIYNDDDLDMYEKIEQIGYEFLNLVRYNFGAWSDEYNEAYQQYETIERAIKLDKKLEVKQTEVKKRIKI